MKKIATIVYVILFFQFQGYSQYIISSGETISCEDLMDDLFLYKKVCLIKEDPETFPFIVYLDRDNPNTLCELVIGQGEELIVPAVMDIVLKNGSTINLTAGGKITGEHFETSKVVIVDDDAVALTINSTTPCLDDNGNVEPCPGSAVSNIMITAPNAINATGLIIDDGSEENEISEVKFRELENGMVVNSDNNVFTDLQFFMVATDLDDCDAEEGDAAAIRLHVSNNNNFTNIFHNRSIGAITVYLDGICNDNTILNISVEQEVTPEDPGCTPMSEGGDPSLYINDLNIVNNIITCNFNHGKTTTADDANNNSTICSNNNISDLGSGCMNANILNCATNTN